MSVQGPPHVPYPCCSPLPPIRGRSPTANASPDPSPGGLTESWGQGDRQKLGWPQGAAGEGGDLMPLPAPQ